MAGLASLELQGRAVLDGLGELLERHAKMDRRYVAGTEGNRVWRMAEAPGEASESE